MTDENEYVIVETPANSIWYDLCQPVQDFLILISEVAWFLLNDVDQ